MIFNVIYFIPIGSDYRITSAELTRMTGLKGQEIRRQINNARSNGVPIGSDKRGYFIAENCNELNHTIAQLNSRVKKMQKAIDGLKKAQKNFNQ